MKLSCSQSELNTALQLVNRAVSTRPHHPVLANILLTADAGTGRLSLTGFDLNLGIRTSVSASVENSGAVTLPARLFSEIISKLSIDSPVHLSSDDLGEKVELTSKSGSYEMRGMNADEFPDLPLVKTGTPLTINPLIFGNALRGTLFACGTDEAKSILTGVNLTFNEMSLTAAASNGHRLAILNLDDSTINSSESDIEDNLEFTLPNRSLKEIERFISTWKNDKEINLFYDSGQVVFHASDQVVTTRTLEGKYPNFKQLIPDSYSHFFEFDRNQLLSALERVAVLAEENKSNVITIIKDDSTELVQIKADAQGVGSGSESIPVKYKGSNIKIAFNVRYLLEGLKAIDSDRILLRCNQPETPAIFSPLDNSDSFIYLVMPIKSRV